MLFPVMQRLEIILPGQGRTQPSVIKCSKISPGAEKKKNDVIWYDIKGFL